MNTVIVDIKGKYAAALTAAGEVKRIVNNRYEIGQEIELYDIQEINHPYRVRKVIHRVIAAAAAIVVFAVGGVATAYAIPYGTVNLEAEPSVAYTINCFDYVIGVNALNEDGEALLSEIDVSKLRHHKIDDAVKTTVEKIESDERFVTDNAGVEITAHTGSSEHTERLQQDLDESVHRDMGLPQKSEEQPQNSENNAQQNNDMKEQPQDTSRQNENVPQENTPQNQDNHSPDNSQRSDSQPNEQVSPNANNPSPNNGSQGTPVTR
jgi:hypothetical protein